MTALPFKVTVTFEPREDGGVRAYSADVPGLVLSSRNVAGLIDDVPTVLQVCLSHQFQEQVLVEPLADIHQIVRDRFASPEMTAAPGPKEFVARFG